MIKSKSYKRKKGITVLESILTILLIGILSVLSVSVFNNHVRGTERVVKALDLQNELVESTVDIGSDGILDSGDIVINISLHVDLADGSFDLRGIDISQDPDRGN